MKAIPNYIVSLSPREFREEKAELLKNGFVKTGVVLLESKGDGSYGTVHCFKDTKGDEIGLCEQAHIAF